MVSLRRSAAAGLAATALALLAAPGCGSSNDGALFGSGGTSGSGGSGATGGSPATGCTKAPDCGQCQACFDLCTCNGGAVDQCLAQCQSSGSGGAAGQAGSAGFGGTGGSGFGGTGGSGFGGTGGSGFGGTGGSGFGGTGGSGFGGAGGSGGGGQSCTSNQQCPSGGGGFVPGCCANDGTCGYDLQGVCAPKNQPGTPDPSCPPLNFQGYVLQGCCNAAHICGYMDTYLGLGCVDPTGFGAPPQGC